MGNDDDGRPRTTSSGQMEPKDTTEHNTVDASIMHDRGIPGLLPATQASEKQKKAVIRFREHEGRGDSPPGELAVRKDSKTVHIDEISSPQSLEYDDCSSSSDDDEIQYCDCVAAALQQSLPGTPGRKGIIPYMSIYDSQQQARKRGYWIPGVPVNAKIVKVERNTDRGIHFINTLLYTIELEHGQFRWSVIRNYKDFTILNNRLMAHRAREQLMAPIKRTQERFDNYLEHIGIDIISDHKPDCPYANQSSKRKKHPKLEVLKRDADGFEEASVTKNSAPLASMESPGDTEEMQKKEVAMQQAVQSGILEDPNATTTSEGSPKRSRRLRKKDRHTLPRFPMMPDSMVTNLEHRKELLENWLQMVLHIPINRNHHETAEFLEVSRYSFVNELGGKHTEGFVKKRPGGSRVFLGWKHCCVRYLLPWSKRWLMVRDSFVAYMDHRTEQIRMVLLMDRDFKVAAGGKETEGIPTGLIITNTQHELHLKCRRVQDTATWKAIIEQSMSGLGSVWLQPHRFSSSFPIREKCHAKWFVEAKTYMEYAADMMELAREEIFIADWWLSPEIYMKRPALEGNYWRLDEILKRKAQQGIKIFILLYKEMEMALGLNSIYTKRTLQGLHENIKVMRHPDHYPSTGTFFWAHHEKLLVIDQLISFVGGVDLCFGRWDDHRHLLTDLGSVQYSGAHQVNTNMQSGLRSLMTAPLTLSPLGLEEHEKVVPRDGKEQHVALKSPVKEEVEEEDEEPKTPEPTEEEQAEIVRITEETVFTDKETGGVKVRTLNRFPVEEVVRHSSPADPQKNWKETKTTVVESTSTTGGLSTKTTTTTTTTTKVIKSVDKYDDKQKKDVRRVVSSLDRQRKHVPREILDRAGPAPSMLEKAAKSGMDFAQAAEKYKEYVASGAVAKEKHRAQTPPNRRKNKKEGKISRAVGNWKSNRAKRKWRQMLESDEATMGYELDWLRLREMDEKEGDDQIDGGAKLWYGKDYVNYIAKDFVEVDMPFHDFIDRGTTPRMPWHDIHSVTFGAPARDVARHYIQRWNATKTEKLKDDTNYPYLLPKSYENVRVPRVFKTATASELVNVQVLRSLSNWSGLINQTEDSIQMAYLSLIANSKGTSPPIEEQYIGVLKA
uniref:Phospholipase n=1 Tax=Caenorhabditis japonica TaxID=281687 RepID=A0A8R1DXK1_CAEJA